jgi:FtsZ-interacting cell division protein ZipA
LTRGGLVTGTTLLIIIIVVAVILLALVTITLFSRRSQTRRREEQRKRTREEFGEEYERTARERGSEEEAEKELRQRRGRVERQVVSLPEESRRHYEERWEEVERVFVDNPERSIEMADRTVSDLLEERNFVADTAQDERETEEGLAAIYPDIAGNYREARRARADLVARSAHGSDTDEGSNEETTEDLRQVLQKYRLVYERISRD